MSLAVIPDFVWDGVDQDRISDDVRRARDIEKETDLAFDLNQGISTAVVREGSIRDFLRKRRTGVQQQGHHDGHI